MTINYYKLQFLKNLIVDQEINQNLRKDQILNFNQHLMKIKVNKYQFQTKYLNQMNNYQINNRKLMISLIKVINQEKK